MQAHEPIRTPAAGAFAPADKIAPRRMNIRPCLNCDKRGPFNILIFNGKNSAASATIAENLAFSPIWAFPGLPHLCHSRSAWGRASIRIPPNKF